MSLFKGLSKEFQVGALTSIAITILILGYNFMRGNDNPFKAGTDVFVYYDSAQGLGVGTSVMFNGLRIGQLSAIGISDDGKRIKTRFEIKANLDIPKDSKMEIQSQIFGGQKVRLILGSSQSFIEDGDVLEGVYAHDQFSTLNDQMVPLVSKADSMLSGLNAFFKNPDLHQAIAELPIVMLEIEKLLRSSQALVKNNETKLNSTLSNIQDFTKDLTAYNKQVSAIVSRLDQSTAGLDSVRLSSAIESLNEVLVHINSITSKLDSGKGSLGNLLNSDTTAVLLQKNLDELNRVLLDLKKYPEKYIPVPFTKSQRNKAKKLSEQDKQVWP